MRKKSGVGNGESSVGNQSDSFTVAHTGNATIWKTQCPNGWDVLSHPLGQPATTAVTTIDTFSGAYSSFCRSLVVKVKFYIHPTYIHPTYTVTYTVYSIDL